MTITTWTGIPFKENQNKLIENLSACLTAKATGMATWANTQKVNPAVDITLKLSLSGDAAYTNPPIYMKIESGTAIYYYFVRHCQRLAENTVLVDCHIDSLNTFASIVESGLSKKTMIKRQHASRFQTEAVPLHYPRSLTLSRKVDEVSEGLSPAKFRSLKETVESDIPSLAGVDFYLIYKTLSETSDETSGNPVSVFLCASTALPIGVGMDSSVTWSAGSLIEGAYYIFLKVDAPFEIRGGESAVVKSDVYDAAVVRKDAGAIKIYGYVLDGGNLVLNYTSEIVTLVTLTLAYAYHTIASGSINYSLAKIFPTHLTFINSGLSGTMNISPLSSIDRTDSRLVKIIKLPYSPCAVTFSNGLYHFPAEWKWLAGLMRLDAASFSASFSNSGLAGVSASGFAASFDFFTEDQALDCAKGYLSDSKLWHSDFHIEKFAYDSFSVSFPLEKSSATGGNAPSFAFTFHQTNTINSNLLFKITPTSLPSSIDQDYGDYIVSSRNNEETIFTNAYINYLRTGYNYDKKSKALSAVARWAGTVASVGGGALATAVGAATGNPIAAATGVTMIAGGIAQLTSAITSQISDENTMQSKLASLQAQATTVAGADDIDLLSDYGSNKLLHLTYDVSSITKSMLEDLFYYYGYAYNKQWVPATSSRIWFNFVQCSPDYTAASAAILGVFQDELASKLNDGITIYHAVAYNSALSWDLDQTKENWETWLAR